MYNLDGFQRKKQTWSMHVWIQVREKKRGTVRHEQRSFTVVKKGG